MESPVPAASSKVWAAPGVGLGTQAAHTLRAGPKVWPEAVLALGCSGWDHGRCREGRCAGLCPLRPLPHSSLPSAALPRAPHC